MQSLSREELAGVIALDLMRPPPKCLTPGQRLLDALPLVLESELRNIPVVNTLAVTPTPSLLIASRKPTRLLAAGASRMS